MKNLLKILALWLVKITGLNLVEPYCLEHLKRMIYSVNADYSKFKYKPFLTELKAISDNGDIRLTIPLLLDCQNLDDVKKVIANMRSSIEAKGYHTKFDVENIHTKEETEFVTENFKEDLERFNVLSGYVSFSQKVEEKKNIVKNSRYFLEVDLLSGTTTIKRNVPLTTLKHNYHGLEISVKGIYTDEQSNNKTIEAPGEGS